MENIINEKFIDFLIKAKKSTYANSTIEKVKSSRVGSSDYHYEEKMDNKNTYIMIHTLVELNLWEKKLYIVTVINLYGE